MSFGKIRKKAFFISSLACFSLSVDSNLYSTCATFPGTASNIFDVNSFYDQNTGTSPTSGYFASGVSQSYSCTMLSLCLDNGTGPYLPLQSSSTSGSSASNYTPGLFGNDSVTSAATAYTYLSGTLNASSGPYIINFQSKGPTPTTVPTTLAAYNAAAGSFFSVNPNISLSPTYGAASTGVVLNNYIVGSTSPSSPLTITDIAFQNTFIQLNGAYLTMNGISANWTGNTWNLNTFINNSGSTTEHVYITFNNLTSPSFTKYADGQTTPYASTFSDTFLIGSNAYFIIPSGVTVYLNGTLQDGYTCTGTIATTAASGSVPAYESFSAYTATPAPGILVFQGSGTIALYGANTYSGGTAFQGNVTALINSSTVVTNGSITSGPFGTPPVTINGSVTPTITSTATTPITIANSFHLTSGLNAIFNSGTGGLTLSGVISNTGGSASISINPNGSTSMVTLSGNNTYSGGTTIYEQITIAGSSTSTPLGTGPVTFTPVLNTSVDTNYAYLYGSGLIPSTVSITTSGSISTRLVLTPTSLTQPIVFQSTVTATTADVLNGSIEFASGAVNDIDVLNVEAGNVSFYPGATTGAPSSYNIFPINSGTQLTINGTYTASLPGIALPAEPATGDFTISMPVSGGNASVSSFIRGVGDGSSYYSLIFTGPTGGTVGSIAGTITLTGTNGNLYSGGTSINSTGLAVLIDNGNQLGSGLVTLSNQGLLGGAVTQTLSTSSTTPSGIVLASGSSSGGGLYASPGTIFTVTTPISGTGPLTVLGSGTTSASGYVVLGGANTYTGATTVYGQVAIAGSAPFGSSSLITFKALSTLSSNTVYLSGSGTISSSVTNTATFLDITPSSSPIVFQNTTASITITSSNVYHLGGTVEFGPGSIFNISTYNLEDAGNLSFFNGATTYHTNGIVSGINILPAATGTTLTLNGGFLVQLPNIGLPAPTTVPPTGNFTVAMPTSGGSANLWTWLRGNGNTNTLYSVTFTGPTGGTAGAIAGTLTIVSNGNGNMYSGGTFIDTTGLAVLISSQIQLGGGTFPNVATDNAGAVTLSNQAILGITPTTGSLALTGVAPAVPSIILAGGSPSGGGLYAPAGTFTIGIPISGTGPLSIIGPGTVVLGTGNSYTGGTNLYSGTLSISSAGQLGAGSLTFNGTGTLLATSTLTLSTTPIVISSGVTASIAASSSTTLAITSTISQTGTGTLMIGSNQITNASGVVSISSASLNGPVTVGAFTTSGTGSSTSIQSYPATLSVSTLSSIGTPTSLTLQGGGILNITSTTSTSTTPFYLNTGGGTLLIASGDTFTQTGAIATTSGATGSPALTVSGGGTVVLSGTNTFSGSLNVQSGSTLEVSSLQNLGSTTATLPIVLTDSTLAITAAANITSLRSVTLSPSGTISITNASPNPSVTVQFGGGINVPSGGTLTLSGSGITTILSLTSDNPLIPNLDVLGGGVIGNTTSLGSSTINIASGGIVTFDQTSAGTFTGMISGAGFVDIDGTEPLTFASTTNTYTGGTVVQSLLIISEDVQSSTQGVLGAPTAILVSSGGTIQTTGSFSTPRTISLVGATNTTFSTDDNTILQLSGPITGLGSLTKEGLGILILSADSSYTGTTYVNQGSLVVTGDITSSVDPIVAAGGLLIGTGSIGTTVVFGTIAGGAPVGTLTIVGDLTLEPGSTFGTVISPPQISLVSVSGAVTIDSNTTYLLALTPGTYNLQGQVVLTGASITGEFTNVEGAISAYFLSSQLEYTGTEVLLTVAERSVSVLASGENAIHVANALDEAINYNRSEVSYTLTPTTVVPSPTPALTYVLASLSPFTTTEEMTYALNQLHPAQLKGMAVSQENNIIQVREALSQRLQNQLDQANCRVCKEGDQEIWVSGLGEFAKQKSTTNYLGPLPGYHVNTGGFALGFDKSFGDFIYAGVLGGFTSSHLHFNSKKGTGSILSGYGGLYVSALGDIFYANASVTGGWSHYSVNRNIKYPGVNLVAKNSHGGRQLLSHLDTGLNFRYENLTIRPFDSFDYVTQIECGYKEHNAGQWELAIKQNNAILLRNELGLQFSTCYAVCKSKWIISPKLSWIREVRVKGDTFAASFAQSGDAFTTTGYFPDRSLIGAGFSLTGLMLDDTLSVAVDYNGAFRGNYQENDYGAQLRYSF